MNKIKLYQFINKLDLQWREKLSLEYSNGISSYWEIYNSYKRRIIFETIQSLIPVIAAVAVGSELMSIVHNTIQEEQEKWH